MTERGIFLALVDPRLLHGPSMTRRLASGVKISVVGARGEPLSGAWSEKRSRGERIPVSEELARTLARDHVARFVPPSGDHDVHVVFFTEEDDVARYSFRAARRDDGKIDVI